MVYQRTYFKVLLGPEKLDSDDGSDGDEPDPPKKHVDRSGFETMADTKVFKRTRPFQMVQPRPRLERYPSSLQLSGLKLHKETSSVKLTSNEEEHRRMESRELVPYNTEVTTFKAEPAEPLNPDNGPHNSQAHSLDISNLSIPVTSTLQTARSSRQSGHYSNRVSKYFLNDFGFRTHRTDTFSGHSTRRGVASGDIEKEMEERANEHIRTCQVIGNVKRGSRAQISYLGFRNTVSPRHSPSARFQMDAFSRGIPKSHTDNVLRVESSPNKHVPYIIQLRRNGGATKRTKNVGILSSDPLPEISGRTLILGTGDEI